MERVIQHTEIANINCCVQPYAMDQVHISKKQQWKLGFRVIFLHYDLVSPVVKAIKH